MKKMLIICATIIILIVSSKEYNKILIPNESIRIRVIANSNNIEDQLLKIKVKEQIEEELYDELKDIKDISSVRNIITKKIPILEKKLNQTINSKDYSINFGKNYFPEKELYGISYNAGNYESLVVNIGESKGNNWWCVLFPPLCMIEAKNTDKDFVEYKSKVLEILKEYK